MNPFFFGPSERPLFGAYHPPASPARRTGVVICNPLGQEHMRTHRALRQLALQLVRIGYPVLRFDYYGTGDSAGYLEEARFEGMIEDTRHALEEIRDTAAVSRITLIGLRLGASIAYVSARGRTDIDSLVLWDPIVYGREYVRELVAVAEPAQRDGAPLGVYGFPVTRDLVQDLDDLDLVAAGPCGAARVVLVESPPRPESAELLAQLDSRGCRTERHIVSSGGDWEDMDRFGAALLPHEVIRAIVTALTPSTVAGG
jgi:alpha/beta superfamily hydrolase